MFAVRVDRLRSSRRVNPTNNDSIRSQRLLNFAVTQGPAADRAIFRFKLTSQYFQLRLRFAPFAEQLLPTFLLFVGLQRRAGPFDECVQAVELIAELSLLCPLRRSMTQTDGQIVPGAPPQALLEPVPGSRDFALTGEQHG